jgi:hypothetical protein
VSTVLDSKSLNVDMLARVGLAPSSFWAACPEQVDLVWNWPCQLLQMQPSIKPWKMSCPKNNFFSCCRIHKTSSRLSLADHL